MNPLVSVIIPTKNSEKTIRLCLESIRNQSYSPFELIVVDNFSKDGTAAIAKGFGKVLEKGPERSAQRNFGVKESQGEYVFFIDSDMELGVDVVSQCVKKIEHEPACQALIIPEVSVGTGFWTRCRALERMCYLGDDLIEAARFFRRNAFGTLGGFDEELWGGEDWDLSQRIRQRGWGIGRISAKIFHHEGKINLRSVLRKKFYYGRSLVRYFQKHQALAKQQFRWFRPAFFRHGWELARHPVLTLGIFWMKGCEFLAGGFGYLTELWVKQLSRK